MHLDETTHEHARSAQVYTYQGDYTIEQDRIAWTAEARRGVTFAVGLSGAIPITSPALPAIAEQAVRDAVVAEIDGIDDTP
ncbi:MAG TPA: hypothetical protein VF169_13930 [Albitalea sp.]|uniref:hypothetical protein n=1 Tax=Piscinibacter sp. TaxID=1903157 RepID=UPI002ED1C751